ncbi:MAG: type II/IV secretion system protein [Desulfobacterales bacterium]|nr:type II/IV secretion system protein [Desulfobacterales bacterium]
MQNDYFLPQNVCNILLNNNLISDEQFKEILEKKDNLKLKLEKKGSSITIIDIIVSLNLYRSDNTKLQLDEDIIYQTLAKEWDIKYKKIDPLKLHLGLVTSTIPRSFAMKHKVLPIAKNNGSLIIATSNPFNIEVFEDISRACQLKVEPVLSSKSDITKLINEFFGFKHSIAEAEIQFSAPSIDLGNLEQYIKLKSLDELPSNDQHVVKAVNHLLTYAFDQRASDVHIEPKRDISLVRMRIDGVLHTIYEIPKKLHTPILSRIKNMSRLDMAEKRKPQDGRIKTDKGGIEIEIRVSTVPVAFGEKVVMRIMDPDILFQDLEKLGFSSTDLIRYNRIISMPHGMILVCGPTGSGKSTTLYSSLSYLSSPEINITTVEDPIEMINESFNQIAVQPAVGVTFGTILRNILRQDPDIIMIGEMRDLETAENAIQAALTGHLVLSSLHTNDAPSSITRLLNIGIAPFLIQATLCGVVAQRLLRKICNYCRDSFTMDTSELKAMSIEVNTDNSNVKLYKGKGCTRCRGTGYIGRTAIFEVLPYVESIRKMTSFDMDLESIRDQSKKEGMITLRENATQKMLSGITTYEEVLRVTVT